MEIQAAIRTVTEHGDLSREDMTAVMRQIMTGQATPSQISGFLIGLRMKGETVDEITAAAGVMRELATRVRATGANVVDIVGTGGDGSATFNISTACCFIVAAAGGQVAKHGNRSVSSKSGSADLLEAAGVSLDLTPEQVATCIDEVGVGFMFAPKHHGAMKFAVGPRREMGVRTIFNVLGPLTNPAGAPNQLMGVFSADLVEPLTNVLGKLGSNHVMVVHAEDGLDEISIGAPTQVAELNQGQVTTYTVMPETFGFERVDVSTLRVEGAEQSLQIINRIFAGEAGAARNIVALNAGAALYVAGLAPAMAEGVRRAEALIDSGAAAAKLKQLAEVSQRLASS